MLVNLQVFYRRASYKYVTKIMKPDGVARGVDLFDGLHLKRNTLWKIIISERFVFPEGEGEC